MSVRIYSGPRSADRRRRHVVLRAVPVLLALGTVVAQVLWVLAEDRFVLTHVVVVTFFLATLTHASVSRGLRWALSYALLTLGFGFGVEFIGTTTGLPFGSYAYSATVAGHAVPAVAGVPVVVPLAWSMMAYPALAVSWRLVGTRSRSAVALVGALALSAWDLFLDPQMVAEGWWAWADPRWALPGLPGIPLQNYVGWLLATAVLMVMLAWLPRRRAPIGVPLALYTWTWVGGIVMNAAWLDRPGVAVWGGIAMGLLAVPALYAVATNRP